LRIVVHGTPDPSERLSVLARYTNIAIVHPEAPEKGVNLIQKPFTIGRLNKVRGFQIKVQIILFRNRLM
jgi:hypothetical protein